MKKIIKFVSIMLTLLLLVLSSTNVNMIYAEDYSEEEALDNTNEEFVEENTNAEDFSEFDITIDDNVDENDNDDTDEYTW